MKCCFLLNKKKKKVLLETITGFQSAFVAGRQISDASLVANELMDNWYRKKEKGVVIKLDLAKT